MKRLLIVALIGALTGCAGMQTADNESDDTGGGGWSDPSLTMEALHLLNRQPAPVQHTHCQFIGQSMDCVGY